MTEAEWLASSDPQAMIHCLIAQSVPGHVDGTVRRPSDRSLRLFAAACGWDVAEAAKTCSNVVQFIRNTEQWAETGQAPPGVREASDPVDIHDRAIDHATGAASWAHLHRGSRTTAELNAAQAALLRDIVGNPWRPVTLPLSADVCKRCRGRGTVSAGAGGQMVGMEARRACPSCRGRGFRSHPWLTPTVLSLARAAYDERPGRECEKCKGTGYEMASPEAYDDPPAYRITCRWGCNKGRIDDGTLDPVPLAVLADALEEAGCPQEVVCPECNGTGSLKDDGDGDNWICRETVSHPLLAHLRSEGPHVRGCWALSLILGQD